MPRAWRLNGRIHRLSFRGEVSRASRPPCLERRGRKVRLAGPNQLLSLEEDRERLWTRLRGAGIDAPHPRVLTCLPGRDGFERESAFSLMDARLHSPKREFGCLQ